MSSSKVLKTTGLNVQLPLALRTGKYIAGFKKSIKSIVEKRSKCVIIASNIPVHQRKQLEYYCLLGGKIPIKFYEGSNNELAIIGGLKFRTSVISVLDQGESDLVVEAASD